MTLERYVKRECADISLPKPSDLASREMPPSSSITDAYHEGGRFGRSLLDRVARLADDQADEFRSQLAAIRRFRRQQTDEQWKAWTGQEFSFEPKGLRCALSVVLVAFPSLLRFVKVRSYTSAEKACSVVWGMWLSPRVRSEPLAPNELSILRNPAFVRGFVDAVAGPSTVD